MALEPTKHVNGRMWPPGVSGNPNGKTCWQSHRRGRRVSSKTRFCSSKCGQKARSSLILER